MEFHRNKPKKNIKPWSFFDDYYNLKKPVKKKSSLREVCNQFTHAYFFQPAGNSRNKLGSIFFVSDRDKEKSLYSINIKYFLKQVKANIDKYPRLITQTYNETKNRWEIITK